MEIFELAEIVARGEVVANSNVIKIKLEPFFACSGPHFYIQFRQNSTMVGRKNRPTSLSYFPLNFTDGYGIFAKLLSSSNIPYLSSLY